MANWFEDLTKTVADDRLSRRQAMRRIAGGVAGVALASWLPEQALAQNLPWKKQCPIGGSCEGSFVNCNGNPNPNCICFTSTEGTPACGCNSYCSQLPNCSSSSQCKRGYVCITANGCTGCGTLFAVCMAKCKGKHKNCQLGSGHGVTATR
jgi:hypothetical protein